MDIGVLARQAADAATPAPDEALSIIAYAVQVIVMVLVTVFMTLRLVSKRYILHVLDLQDCEFSS
jgi:Na+/glutamate symporter